VGTATDAHHEALHVQARRWRRRLRRPRVARRRRARQPHVQFGFPDPPDGLEVGASPIDLTTALGLPLRAAGLPAGVVATGRRGGPRDGVGGEVAAALRLVQEWKVYAVEAASHGEAKAAPWRIHEL
jgi:hypothetical protein